MLIVIDMQQRFPAHKTALRPVLKEIDKAKENNEFILLVEYADYRWGDFVCTTDPTVAPITKRLNNYDNWDKVVKNDNGGGFRIYRSFPEKFTGDVKVCGINTAACVRSTVEELNSVSPVPIIVLSHACKNYRNIKRHRETLSEMKRFKNVVVL